MNFSSKRDANFQGMCYLEGHLRVKTIFLPLSFLHVIVPAKSVKRFFILFYITCPSKVFTKTYKRLYTVAVQSSELNPCVHGVLHVVFLLFHIKPARLSSGVDTPEAFLDDYRGFEIVLTPCSFK